MIESLDTVLFTVICVAPGYYMAKIIDAINPTEKKEFYSTSVRWIVLSLLNLSYSMWLFKLLSSFKNLSNTLFWLILPLGVSFIGSILALLLAWFKHKQILRILFKKSKISPTHSIPYAWDYAFHNSFSHFIVVTLIDGSQIFGWYSTNSIASSEPDQRDIFIEKTYSYNDTWKEIEPSEGIWIRGDQIRAIEFLKGEYKND